MAYLEISDLSVYHGNLEAVHSISLSAKKGSITTIIGSNGAGKSTILNALSGLLTYKGKIRIAGKDLPKSCSRIVKRGVVQVPEGRCVFAGLSVEENLKIGAFPLHDKREVRALLDEQYELFPLIKERRDQDAGTLSGGEQQMLVICRALMAKPQLLLLDEPSLGLAPLIVKEVFRNIVAIKEKGITVLLVEQNAKKALCICDYAYVIENGILINEGQGMDLLADPDVVSAYLGSDKNALECVV